MDLEVIPEACNNIIQVILGYTLCTRSFAVTEIFWPIFCVPFFNPNSYWWAENVSSCWIPRKEIWKDLWFLKILGSKWEDNESAYKV